MRTLLSHAYFIHEDVKEQKIMRPYPPLGLLYVSAYLKENEIETGVIDSTFLSENEWKQEVENYKPEVICLYTNLMTKIKLLELVKWVKSVLPKTKIVAGGPDVTYNLENYLKHGIDICVIGEGEESCLELIQCLQTDSDLKIVNGLAFLDDKNELVKTAPRMKMKDLSQLPLPDRESIPIEKYLQIWKENHGAKTLNISTQRGCPYTCKWCSTAVYGQSYRRRPAAKVVDEIQMLQERYGVEALWFVDDVFTVSHKWIDAFHQEIKQRKVKIAYEIITRAERLNEKVLTQLKESGCFRIWIGAESGSQKIIDAMDRRVDVQQVRDMINLTESKGIEAGTFIMVGYPGEQWEDIEETVNHLKEATPSHFTLTKAYPIKGTSLYSDMENQLIHPVSWAHSSDRDIDFPRSFPDAFYPQAIRYISNSFESFKHKKNGNKIGQLKALTKAKIAKTLMKKESK